MKRSYQATIEEFVEVYARFAEFRGTLSKYKWLGGMAVGLICFSVLSLVLRIVERDPVIILAVSGGAAAMGTCYYLATYKRDYRRRIRRTLVKSLQTDQPVPSEWEIDSVGLAFRSFGQEMKVSWSNVQEIKTSDGCIEVLLKPPGLFLIPTRVFESTEECLEWLTYMEDHAPRAKA